jgi:hypothetical protein
LLLAGANVVTLHLVPLLLQLRLLLLRRRRRRRRLPGKERLVTRKATHAW